MSKAIKKQIPKKAIESQTIAAKADGGSSKYPLRLKLIVLLGLISCLVYANTLKNSFALDDGTVITENSIVKRGIPAIPEILSTPYRHGLFKNATNDLYRPLSLVMFATEYQLFKTNPLPYHLINILLFACCVILLFLVLDKLFERKKLTVAFIAALLFALHPIHTEIVANIKSRDELLCFFFAFLSINIFIKYTRSGKLSQLIAGSFCFVLSMLSKETVITFIAVIPFVFFFYLNENKKRSAYISLCTLLAAIFCIIIRFSVLNYYHANEIASINFTDNALTKTGLPVDSRLATAILILGFYVKLLLVPYPLLCDYSFNSIPFTQFSDPLVLASLALYIFLAFFSIKRFLKNQKDPYAFAILFFLITISLFSNIPFLIGTTMGERLLFFPSVGFCLLTALLIEKYIAGKERGVSILKSPKILSVIIPVSFVYAFLTINRNNDWSDSFTLFRADAEKAVNDCKLHFDVGDMALNASYAEKDTAKKRQLIIESISNLERAVEIYPEYTIAQIDLGWAFYQVNKYDSAEKHEGIAMELAPSNKIAINDLATAYNANKKYPQAITLFKKVLELDPASDGTEYDLGDAYFSIGQYDSAEIYLRPSLLKNPKNSGAVNDLAGIYFYRKEYTKAIEMYKNAISLNPGYVKPYANIGICYVYLTRYDSAISYSNKAIVVDPSFNSTYEILAAAYKAMNKTDSARKYESVAQKNDPGFKL